MLKLITKYFHTATCKYCLTVFNYDRDNRWCPYCQKLYDIEWTWEDLEGAK